ncbi:MAG: hypothetical protein KAW93_01945, partial [Methanogenium sp.]|nr:hypothetical protein [Methanogenium sp.]
YVTNDNPSPNKYETLSLVAGKTTDVLKFRPHKIPSGLTLDPISAHGGVKAAIYSASFILKSEVAKSQDIDPNEIEICNFQRSGVTGGYVGDLTLSDKLPNGSGFVGWIQKNWSGLLNQMLHPDVEDESFSAFLISDEHSQSCSSACYDCLMSFWNMRYHGLLDWRLGLSYLRCLDDRDYQCGLDGNFNLPELMNWQDHADKLTQNYAMSFNFDYHENSIIPMIKTKNSLALIVHPLWDTLNPSGILKAAIDEVDGEIDVFVDTFNLLRRPGWCRRLM